MKAIFQFSFLASFLACFLLTGCEQDRCVRTEEYISYEPVYKRIEEMRVPATFESPRSLSAPGKIFYYKGFLLINEIQKGIHIIDNSNPSAPLPVGFINIPGSLDMAVSHDRLYVDNYLDLVTIDITNPRAPVELNRVTDVFQNFYSYTDALGYLVEYVPTPKHITIDCDDVNWGRGIWFEGDVLFAEAGAFDASGIKSNSSVNSSVATGGSMARFTVANEYLYTIDGSEIKIFDVKDPLPVYKNEVEVQGGIETLFPMADHLFIGSNSGLLIYNISYPESPEYRSTFSHATACDPVVVSGTTAYVTLRDGTPCNGFVNQLDVIDVSNLYNPFLIKSYPMDNPHGLSIIDQTLYLCEGSFGLKTFDISDNQHIDQNQLDHINGFFGWDVIVLPPGDLVMVIGKDGLYQFDAKDRTDLKPLSVISIEQ
jgi:hypothetical protein